MRDRDPTVEVDSVRAQSRGRRGVHVRECRIGEVAARRVLDCDIDTQLDCNVAHRRGWRDAADARQLDGDAVGDA